MEDKLTTIICRHCERAIPLSNVVLHSVHCSRFLDKCKICGDIVPKMHAEGHFLNTHAPCGVTVDRDIIYVHNGEQCPQRMVPCEFCELPLPAIDISIHQDVCGNRTNLCYRCNKYIKLRETIDHVSQCDPFENGWSCSEADQTDDSSSNGEEDSTDDSSSKGEENSTDDRSSNGEEDSTDDSSSNGEEDSTDDSYSNGEEDSSDDSSFNGEKDSTDDSSSNGEEDSTDDSSSNGEEDSTDDSV